jgi:hypothetical protein
MYYLFKKGFYISKINELTQGDARPGPDSWASGWEAAERDAGAQVDLA